MNNLNLLSILNVSDPTNAYLLAEDTLPFFGFYGAYGVALRYPYAYVAAGGLAIVNISNPYNPEILGIYGRQLLKEANDVSCNEHYTFVGSNSGITIFDISNPQIPIYKSHLSVNNIQRLLLYDSLLFASNPNLYIVDISHPSNPHVLYLCDSVYTSDFDIYGNLLCWVGVVDSINFLRIFDLTDPSNPSNPYIVSTFTLSDASDTRIVNNKLFTIDNYNYGVRGILSVFDLTNPIVPHRITSSITDGVVYNKKLTWNDNYIYLCNREAFAIYEFSETGINDVKEEEKRALNIYVCPNPFRNEVSISLTCKKGFHLQASIYDVTGRMVKKLFCGKVLSNRILLGWDGTNENGKPLPQATYFCKVNQSDVSRVRKIIKLN